MRNLTREGYMWWRSYSDILVCLSKFHVFSDATFPDTFVNSHFRPHERSGPGRQRCGKGRQSWCSATCLNIQYPQKTSSERMETQTGQGSLEKKNRVLWDGKLISYDGRNPAGVSRKFTSLFGRLIVPAGCRMSSINMHHLMVKKNFANFGGPAPGAVLLF